MSSRTPAPRSDPSDSSSGWFYVHRGEPRGPVSARYLRALFDNGDLAPNALVRGPGVNRWHPADELLHPDLPRRAPKTPTSERIDLDARGQAQSIFDEMAEALRPPDSDPPAGDDLAPEPLPAEAPDLVPPPALPSPFDTPAPAVQVPSPYDLVSTEPAAPEEPTASPYEPEEDDSAAELIEGLTLDDVLGEVERRKDLEMSRRRRQGIRRAAQRQRFEMLTEERLKPQLRRLMERLHARGYPTRLRQLHKRHLRFEFTLEAHRVIRCNLEIELQEDGFVEVAFLRDLQPLYEQRTHVDDLEAEEIQSLLANFVKISLG